LPEAGTYSGNIEINNADSPKAIITIPANAAGKSIHIICEITDNGTPVLTGYRRVVITPK
jgi:hypothetical protein